ncbi:GIY-YIG nuclease family protein [Pedobacter sp. P26]|uniref:GIY-YIG nuclease family protein n=1 Tax=Pedobacter sp. P26 TaxID=3423956 RepID=UPI003D667572
MTTRNSKERASELSKTGVPDKHYVMREWNVFDCKLAEKEIHELLKAYRLDPRREYFKWDMDIICETVQTVVDRINSTVL